MLEYVRASFKFIRNLRPMLSCVCWLACCKRLHVAGEAARHRQH